MVAALKGTILRTKLIIPIFIATYFGKYFQFNLKNNMFDCFINIREAAEKKTRQSYSQIASHL